jgi:hypothetical protein|tara:strand:- start:818 stop:994 length:177 start_codon:yes stop_codon:yes gene_type:complete
MARGITNYKLDGCGTLTTFVGTEVYDITYNVESLFEAQLNIQEQNYRLFNQFLINQTK